MSVNPFEKYHDEVIGLLKTFRQKRGMDLNFEEIRSLLIALENEEDDYLYQKWIIDNFPEMVDPDVLENLRREVEHRKLN